MPGLMLKEEFTAVDPVGQACGRVAGRLNHFAGQSAPASLAVGGETPRSGLPSRACEAGFLGRHGHSFAQPGRFQEVMSLLGLL